MNDDRAMLAYLKETFESLKLVRVQGHTCDDFKAVIQMSVHGSFGYDRIPEARREAVAVVNGLFDELERARGEAQR